VGEGVPPASGLRFQCPASYCNYGFASAISFPAGLWGYTYRCPQTTGLKLIFSRTLAATVLTSESSVFCFFFHLMYMCWAVSMTLHDISVTKPRQQADWCNSTPLPYNMWANGDVWLCSESMWFWSPVLRARVSVEQCCEII